MLTLVLTFASSHILITPSSPLFIHFLFVITGFSPLLWILCRIRTWLEVIFGQPLSTDLICHSILFCHISLTIFYQHFPILPEVLVHLVVRTYSSSFNKKVYNFQFGSITSYITRQDIWFWLAKLFFFNKKIQKEQCLPISFISWGRHFMYIWSFAKINVQISFAIL